MALQMLGRLSPRFNVSDYAEDIEPEVTRFLKSFLQRIKRDNHGRISTRILHDSIVHEQRFVIPRCDRAIAHKRNADRLRQSLNSLYEIDYLLHGQIKDLVTVCWSCGTYPAVFQLQLLNGDQGARHLCGTHHYAHWWRGTLNAGQRAVIGDMLKATRAEERRAGRPHDRVDDEISRRIGSFGGIPEY